MTRVYLFVILTFHLTYVQNERVTWLMQGDVLTQTEATSQHIRLITYEYNFPVNSDISVYFARAGYFVSCVIAASVYGKGYVSVIEGGYGTKEVRVFYVMKNDGEPDVLHFFVQAVTMDVKGNVAESARQSIVYEPIRNWTLDETQDTLDNAN